MSALRYVYGIVPAPAAPRVDAAGLAGIDGSTVRTIADGPIAAAQSQLDEAAWGPDVLNTRVADMDWLTPRAEAHQQVNARLLEIAGVVLPLTFGALYRDDARVREMLREDVDARRRRLADLAGKAEWVVTVVRDVAATPGAEEELRALDTEITASTPGRGYLLEKRRTRVASEANERSDADAAQRALTILASVGERTYREPVATGGGDVVVVRVSLLAPRSRASQVSGAIAALEEDLGRAYGVRASGPWPAYRFGALP